MSLYNFVTLCISLCRCVTMALCRHSSRAPILLLAFNCFTVLLYRCTILLYNTAVLHCCTEPSSELNRLSEVPHVSLAAVAAVSSLPHVVLVSLRHHKVAVVVWPENDTAYQCFLCDSGLKKVQQKQGMTAEKNTNRKVEGNVRIMEITSLSLSRGLEKVQWKSSISE